MDLRDLLAFSRDNIVTSSIGTDLGGLFSYQILHLEILQCTFPFLDKLKGSSETQTGCAYMCVSAVCILLRQRLLTCVNPSKIVFIITFGYRAYLAENSSSRGLEVIALQPSIPFRKVYGKIQKCQYMMFL